LSGTNTLAYFSAASASKKFDKIVTWSFHDAIFGDVANATAGQADDAVGVVGLVLALPALVVSRAAVRAPEADPKH
jgi:hypothetical protein